MAETTVNDASWDMECSICLVFHHRCSFEDECPSSLWLSVPDDLSQRRMLSHSFQEDAEGKVGVL
jgi:hypothetical protein